MYNNYLYIPKSKKSKIVLREAKTNYTFYITRAMNSCLKFSFTILQYSRVARKTLLPAQ